jgi:mannobiose 2-epimerase
VSADDTARVPGAETTPSTAGEPGALADEMEGYLWEHVLGPRFPRCVDRERGGFHTNYARDWSPLEDEGRFVVYDARVTWTAAAIALRWPARRAEYLSYVRHGVRALADVMWDREHGGFHTFVDLFGRPAREGRFRNRPVYGQAFAIYGLAAAHAATGDEEPLDLARRGWRWIEDHHRDDLGPGYCSAVRADGQPFATREQDQLGELDSIDGPALHRTMNDHIHLLEAYAELLGSWPDPELRGRTEELLRFVRDRLFVEPGCLYLALRPDGRPVPAPVSFGHDVETAFLLLEAEEALGHEPQPRTVRAARMLVDHALDRGFDTVSGQLFEYGSAYGEPVDRSIEWWAQFEAMNAFLLMHEIHGRETDRYWTAFSKAWALSRDRLTDRRHPGVCPGIDAQGKVMCDAKSHLWFACYHTARSLLLCIDRLRGLMVHGPPTLSLPT